MLFIADSFAEILRQIGFTPERVFSDPAIKPWRSLPDRQNCIWDLHTPTGTIRLHVKRFPPSRTSPTDAETEAVGYQLLQSNGIPTPDLVSHATLEDGRSFIITQDLSNYSPADKLIESGLPFESLLIPTADLSAKLHGSGLHHRDLYLCHFLAKNNAVDTPNDAHLNDLRLIDAARVRRLPGPFTRRRWIVKDLAQFWYSTLALPITDDQRNRWLTHYAQKTALPSIDRLRSAILRKVKTIAAHDAKLNRTRPSRNISIPKD